MKSIPQISTFLHAAKGNGLTHNGVVETHGSNSNIHLGFLLSSWVGAIASWSFTHLGVIAAVLASGFSIFASYQSARLAKEKRLALKRKIEMEESYE